MSTETFEQQLIGNISTAILVVDAGLELLFVNPAGEILLGLSANKLLGQKLPGLFAEDQGLLSQLREMHNVAQQCVVREVELRVVPNDKSIVVDCIATVMHQDRGANQLIIELTEVNRLLRMV
ncbi:PAS domain-containing protein, partial [Pseudomonadota bacterium]